MAGLSDFQIDKAQYLDPWRQESGNRVTYVEQEQIIDAINATIATLTGGAGGEDINLNLSVASGEAIPATLDEGSLFALYASGAGTAFEGLYIGPQAGGTPQNIFDALGSLTLAADETLSHADTGVIIKDDGYIDDTYITNTRFSENGHIHDDRYYTEAESNALFSAVGHTHDSRYYTETEADSLFAPIVHTHDDRYYTETEADALFAAAVHNHDDRYYTETETDTLLSGKADVFSNRAFLDLIDQGLSTTSNVQFNNLQLTGTVDYVNESNLQVVDKTITVNKTGNDGSAEGSGLIIERNPSTDMSILWTSAAGFTFSDDLAFPSGGYSGSLTSTGTPFADSQGTYTGSQLGQTYLYTELIRANELRVKAFTAEVSAALYGEDVLTKSRGVVSRDFTVPATTGTLYVEDLEGVPNAAVFEPGDWIRLIVVDRSGGGLLTSEVWGTVSNYSDLAGGEQSWTFTLDTGNAGDIIYQGSIAVDYGTSGDAIMERSVIGANTPRDTQYTWVTDPTVPGNYTIQSRIGNLTGITDSVLGTLSGYGIYTTNAYFRGAIEATSGLIGGWSINTGSESKLTSSSPTIGSITLTADDGQATPSPSLSMTSYFTGLVGDVDGLYDVLNISPKGEAPPIRTYGNGTLTNGQSNTIELGAGDIYRTGSNTFLAEFPADEVTYPNGIAVVETDSFINWDYTIGMSNVTNSEIDEIEVQLMTYDTGLTAANTAQTKTYTNPSFTTKTDTISGYSNGQGFHRVRIIIRIKNAGVDPGSISFYDLGWTETNSTILINEKGIFRRTGPNVIESLGGGGGVTTAVSSVHGRIGDVVSATGDYSFAQISDPGTFNVGNFNDDGTYLTAEVDPKGVSAVNITGTTSKTLTITLNDASQVQTTFSDINTNTQRTDEEIRDVVGATLVAGSNVSIAVDDPGNTVTISSSYVNTTYSAGTGLSLVGTTFSLSGDSFSSTGTYAGLRAQATTASDVGLGNVPNLTQAQFTQQISNTALTDASDLNTTVAEGFYSWTTGTSRPANSPSTYMGMMVIEDQGQPIQMALGSSAAGEIYVRRRDSGTWYGWTRFWNESNLTDVSQLTNDANYITISSVNNSLINITAGTWLDGSGSFNLNQASSSTITLDVNTASVLSAVTGNATWNSSNFNSGNWDSAYTHSTATGNPHSVTASQLTSGTLPDERLSLNSIPVRSDEMSNTVNLNNLSNQTDAGFYHQSANADTPGNGYPVDLAGSLLIQKSAGVTQTYITYDASTEMYFRAHYNSSWGSWRKVWHSADFSSTDITQWGTAYTERRQWDGGSTNLNATTARTSLGLTGTSNTTHYHDGRYFTETEINNFFSGATAKTGYNKSNWDAAYTHLSDLGNPHGVSPSQIGALSTSGGTISGTLSMSVNAITNIYKLHFSNEESTDATNNGDMIYDQSSGLWLRVDYATGSHGAIGTYRVLDTGMVSGGTGITITDGGDTQKVTFALSGDSFSSTGTYASLRAQATTKADVGLGNVANVDTTNAANISSGLLNDARLPSLISTGTLKTDNGQYLRITAGEMTLTGTGEYVYLGAEQGMRVYSSTANSGNPDHFVDICVQNNGASNLNAVGVNGTWSAQTGTGSSDDLIIGAFDSSAHGIVIRTTSNYSAGIAFASATTSIDSEFIWVDALNQFQFRISGSTVATLSSAGVWTLSGNSQAPDHTDSSDYRLKSNPEPVEPLAIAQYAKLYKYNKEGLEGVQYGLMAHHMKEYNDDFVGYADHEKYGKILTLSPYSLASVALSGVNELHERIKVLEKQVRELGGTI